jgi:hypothetical protein
MLSRTDLRRSSCQKFETQATFPIAPCQIVVGRPRPRRFRAPLERARPQGCPCHGRVACCAQSRPRSDLVLGRAAHTRDTCRRARSLGPDGRSRDRTAPLSRRRRPALRPARRTRRCGAPARQRHFDRPQSGPRRSGLALDPARPARNPPPRRRQIPDLRVRRFVLCLRNMGGDRRALRHAQRLSRTGRARKVKRIFLLVLFSLALVGCVSEPVLVHPTLSPERQAAIRAECEASLPAASATLPRCPDIGGDRQALERCRSDGDAALLAAVRRDQAVAACLRAQGFR